MFIRRIILCLLLCSMFLLPAVADRIAPPVPAPSATTAPAPLDSDGLPSKEFTFALMQSNPELVWQMVRKLYSIEHALPIITIPALTFIQTTDKGLIVGYEKPEGSILLGINPSYQISFTFDLKQSVVSGYKPAPDNTIYYILAGVGVFGLGMLAGHVFR